MPKDFHLISILIMVMGMFLINVSCSDNSTSTYGEEESEETIEVNLSDINKREALTKVSDDTSFTWQGAATWDKNGRFNNSGTTYSEWKVTITGENGEELTLDIVEAEESSEMPGPDDCTYEAGTGQTQNSIRFDTGVDVSLSENSKDGSFTVTQASDGSVLEIELTAAGLEIGGIGSQYQFVDVEAAIKATRE